MNMNNIEKKCRASTASNGRFGAMAALAPQKRQCELGSYYSARSVVEAATAPSRWDVVGKPRERSTEKDVS
jgi:hypothetical protein